MTTTFYVQTDIENRVTDIIDYSHDGYFAVELATPLPASVIGGAYQLVSGNLIYRPEWDNQAILKRIEDAEMAIVELLMASK